MKHLKTIFLLPAITFLFAFCSFAPVLEAKIVFTIRGDIYAMNDDGTGKQQLTDTGSKIATGRDIHPQWSQDGKRIAFSRRFDRRQSTYELFIMNADGTNVQRLTDNNVFDSYPSWSPDGKRIAFDSQRSGGWEVHVIDLATLHVTQLTDRGDDRLGGSVSPHWSPDGTQIVYEKFVRHGIKNIYVMSANGEDQRPFLPDPEQDDPMVRFHPMWSADGRRVVFDDCPWQEEADMQCRLSVATRHGKLQQLHGIYDILGDNLVVGIVCWMNNDKELLLDLKLLGTPQPNYDIYRYNLNAKSLKRLTQGKENEDYPHWIEGSLSVSPQDKKK